VKERMTLRITLMYNEFFLIGKFVVTLCHLFFMQQTKVFLDILLLLNPILKDET
jgi:hypothetical protein